MLACGSSSTPTTENSNPTTLQAAEVEGVIPGIEVLLTDSLPLIRNRRVGIITHHTGRDRRGTSSIDLLHKTPGVRLTAIFDSATGVPIHSLYGATRTPTPRMLANVDVLLYDIQDVGARVYTYVWTMALAAEAAKRAGKRFVVLDRPNPIRADRIEGGVLEPRYKSFTGLHPVALLRAIYARHRRAFRWEGNGIELLSGSRALRLAVESGNIEGLLQRWSEESDRFLRTVAAYRLYR